MENGRNKILVIASDPTFVKLQRSVVPDGPGPSEARYNLVRAGVYEDLIRDPVDAAVVEGA